MPEKKEQKGARQMKTVLCFGDSNTYGYNPRDGKRFPPKIRWTGVLQNLVNKDQVEIIEEGLVGRTSVFEDSVRPGRKGIDYLVPLVESHNPVDKLVLMLGTNDCKTIYNTSEKVIGMGIEQLIKRVRAYNPALDILLISPIHLGELVWKEEFDPEFNQRSVEVSKGLKSVYQKIAEKYHCDFLAASDVAKPSEEDQEHLDEEGHRALANAIYQYI